MISRQLETLHQVPNHVVLEDFDSITSECNISTYIKPNTSCKRQDNSNWHSYTAKLFLAWWRIEYIRHNSTGSMILGKASYKILLGHSFTKERPTFGVALNIPCKDVLFQCSQPHSSPYTWLWLNSILLFPGAAMVTHEFWNSTGLYLLCQFPVPGSHKGEWVPLLLWMQVYLKPDADKKPASKYVWGRAFFSTPAPAKTTSQ